MLSNTQLLEIVSGNIEKNVVLDEIQKGRYQQQTTMIQKRK